MFSFALSQQVNITPGAEIGTVEARAEYVSGPNHYRVHYIDGQGCT